MANKTGNPVQIDERRTWTFEPTDTVRAFVKKRMIRAVGLKNINNPKLTRGLRTKFINEALEAEYPAVKGKSKSL